MTDGHFDILIIGSGPSGANAAVAAVQHGLSVGLVDVGNTDTRYEALIPDIPFSSLRESDPDQHRYFLGDDLEGVPAGNVRVGAQLTPPRQHITRDTERLQPIVSDTFFPMQSLALGGLGAGWGAGCTAFESSELERIGFHPGDILPYYRTVSADIGVSGSTSDDTAPHLAMPAGLQPPLEIDSNAETIYSRYQAHRQKFLRRGFKMGHIPMAVLTEPLRGRQANPYFDMDFYGASRESIYRPKYTIRGLSRHFNFTYVNRTFVDRFEECERDGESVTRLLCWDVDTGKSRVLECKRLLLAAGAINTGRIALRSLGFFDTPIPILCNPYTYIPTINLAMLGRPARNRRHSLAQLTGLLMSPDDPQDIVSAQFFSYRSLLMFKLVKEMPLPAHLGLLTARLLATSLTIIGVHHADTPSPDRWLQLKQGTGGRDVLEAHYTRSAGEKAKEARRERQIIRNLLALRCIPIGLVHPGNASSIHYAGTLPFGDEGKPLTCDRQGRLNGTQHIYVADGACFRSLPAKGLTFTLMANARRVADIAAQSIQR